MADFDLDLLAGGIHPGKSPRAGAGGGNGDRAGGWALARRGGRARGANFGVKNQLNLEIGAWRRLPLGARQLIYRVKSLSVGPPRGGGSVGTKVAVDAAAAGVPTWHHAPAGRAPARPRRGPAGAP